MIALIKINHGFQAIYIHYNTLRYIHGQAFKGLGSLKMLSIRDSDLLVPPSLNFLSRTLTHLTLSKNKIAVFPSDYFDGCSVLKKVVIFMSRIVRIPRMDASHGQLSELLSSANHIVDIRHLYGVAFLKLKVLDLQRNQIVMIEVHLMILPVVEHVALTMNNMVEIPNLTESKWGEELPGNGRINMVIGEGNPWHCSTRMLWVLDLNCRVNCNTNNLHHRVDIIDVENMVCHSPADMTGKKITDVGKFEWKCI